MHYQTGDVIPVEGKTETLLLRSTSKPPKRADLNSELRVHVAMYALIARLGYYSRVTVLSGDNSKRASALPIHLSEVTCECVRLLERRKVPSLVVIAREYHLPQYVRPPVCARADVHKNHKKKSRAAKKNVSVCREQWSNKLTHDFGCRTSSPGK